MPEILIPKLIITKQNQYSIAVNGKNYKMFKYVIIDPNYKDDKHTLEVRDNRCDLGENSVFFLKELASVACIKGYSKMKKAELVKELTKRVIFE